MAIKQVFRVSGAGRMFKTVFFGIYGWSRGNITGFTGLRGTSRIPDPGILANLPKCKASKAVA